ncbi:type VII secretion-associated serine protease mycosin [Amycolatopsis sp. CA-230715]|uniref:type VII secretion-associated serine protease mycosin n=1 Tax=Amycolatopsis sp. CA-230715 TaxID=2745196 RepID=UPI001C031A2E|nr:type VII secretion-associated serine protease mycosin [Amycolatopsis sp. CA-230715]QWF79629.1 hypothetical protein HUW46_03038 [Amycolatopsis sp. CA-230715]
MPATRYSKGARVRSLKVPGRVTAATLAATVAVLGPGLTPVTAEAQPSNSGTWKPPPLSGTAPPDDGGGHGPIAYEKSKECVKRKLGASVQVQNAPWGQDYLQIRQAQQLAVAKRGSAGGGIRVAVIDTGVRAHPGLADRLEPGGDYVTPTGDGTEDCDGHGTEVAGIIAGKTGPDIGFTGVAPDAHIVTIRQSSQNYKKPDKTAAPPAPPSTGTPPPGGSGQPQPPSQSQLPPSQSGGGPAAEGTGPQQQGGGGGRQQGDGEGSAGTVDTLAMAVRHAADSANMVGGVINMSVDNCRPSFNGAITPGERKLQAAIHYAVAEKNIVVVAAAGNKSEGCPQNDQADPNQPKTIVTPPWFNNEVLSVGAIDSTGGIADFSIRGPWVSVAAPGTDIISLDPAEGSSELANQTIENGKEQTIQGTSFAAPYVSGVVALVRAQFPNLTAAQVMHRITSTAQHPGANGGRDNFVGYGVVNPIAALTAIVPEEEGITLPGNPPPDNSLPELPTKNWTPMVVALAGTGGGLVALLITLFVVHTIRRNRPEGSSTQNPA